MEIEMKIPSLPAGECGEGGSNGTAPELISSHKAFAQQTRPAKIFDGPRGAISSFFI